MRLACGPDGGLLTRITRALPGNAAAKRSEGFFAAFNQQVLKHMPGFIGDDRMNLKSPHRGKLPAPFPGGFDAFRERLFELLKAYEHMPQQGLGGRSPSQVFASFVADDWAATVMKEDQLNTVFVKREVRLVRWNTSGGMADEAPPLHPECSVKGCFASDHAGIGPAISSFSDEQPEMGEQPRLRHYCDDRQRQYVEVSQVDNSIPNLHRAIIGAFGVFTEEKYLHDLRSIALARLKPYWEGERPPLLMVDEFQTLATTAL